MAETEYFILSPFGYTGPFTRKELIETHIPWECTQVIFKGPYMKQTTFGEEEGLRDVCFTKQPDKE